MEATIIEAEVIEALRSCFDPEIPVNIYELGLIYDVKIDPSGAVGIRMTLTSPSCPAAQSLPAEVQAKAKDVRGVTDVTVDVVWDPPWEPSKMSEAARLQLGFMAESKVTLEKTKIGSPYVISAIDKLRRAGTHTRIVGWEANGGFLTGSDIPLTAGTLIALPTRDSSLPILANLFASAEQRIGLAALWNRLPARFGRAGLLDNVPVAVSQAILAHLIPPGDVIEVEFDGAGRVFDRSRPGTAPVPLAEPEIADWQERKATLMHFFTSALGFDDIIRINVLDGLRLYFRSGDVAHIRPSGNAPQLRIYANSDSQARADQIVELGLREPDGILRQLERAFTQNSVTTSR